MASRVSKTWTKKDNLEVKLSDPVTKNNFANYLLAMSGKDLTFDFLMTILGNFDGECIANAYDLLVVPANTFAYKTSEGKSATNKSEFTTTVGLYIFNLLLSSCDLTHVVGYINKNINGKSYGKVIDQQLVYALIEDRITVDQFKKWQMTLQWLMPLQDVISTNHTEKILTVGKAIAKRKAELIKANQEAIDSGDPKVIEDIEKELLELAKEYIGEDSGMDSLNSAAGAKFENQFKNMYIIKGAVANPDPNAAQKYNIVTSSYIEGIKPDEYTVLGQSGVNGSFSRGKKTSVGGYWEKLFINSLQHVKLDPKDSDCGTKRHITIVLTEDNLNKYIYSYAIKDNGSLELITSQNYKKFLGKKTKIRFSSMCESRTGLCNKCVGELIYAASSENVGTTTGQIPDKIKNIAMKSFHDSTVTNYTITDLNAIFYPE